MAQACFNDRQYFLIQSQNNNLGRCSLVTQKSENEPNCTVDAVESRKICAIFLFIAFYKKQRLRTIPRFSPTLCIEQQTPSTLRHDSCFFLLNSQPKAARMVEGMVSFPKARHSSCCHNTSCAS